ncbi:uncharacterized protein [Penaeus vannamei]|uniref:uncharacterized protein n=1 Tax=Penaeus vannamei TaxID=6689 RepID=UPI00387F449F
MSRFLRRLFCCCFPEVDDDAERILTHGTSVDRRPTTIFGSSSNTLTLPYTSRADALTLPYTSTGDALTLPYTSRADALTLPYTSTGDALTLPYTSRADALTLPYTSRADALILPYTSRHAASISSGITIGPTNFTTDTRPHASVSRPGIAKRITYDTYDSASRRCNASSSYKGFINWQKASDPKPEGSIYKPYLSSSKLDESDGKRTAVIVALQGPEISSQTLLNRETLQSKYTGHPALNLHFGFRDLEDIIQHRSRPVLDLHGMTVREAKMWVEFFLHLHQQSGTKVIEVVTGRGNNSADGKPKIKPAVEELLDDLELQFREMHKGGSLLVQL